MTHCCFHQDGSWWHTMCKGTRRRRFETLASLFYCLTHPQRVQHVSMMGIGTFFVLCGGVGTTFGTPWILSRSGKQDEILLARCTATECSCPSQLFPPDQEISGNLFGPKCSFHVVYDGWAPKRTPTFFFLSKPTITSSVLLHCVAQSQRSSTCPFGQVHCGLGKRVWGNNFAL